jgi:hypothetical protein
VSERVEELSTPVGRSLGKQRQASGASEGEAGSGGERSLFKIAPTYKKAPPRSPLSRGVAPGPKLKITSLIFPASSEENSRTLEKVYWSLSAFKSRRCPLTGRLFADIAAKPIAN